MARAVSNWLFVVPCLVVYTGTARTRELPPPNAAQSPPAIEQYLPPTNVAESPSVIEPANPISTARAQYLPPPNAAERPPAIEPTQHVAATSSFDADSIGNRNVYLDATFAPFSGIYESGPRFRVVGNASWYRFVLSEDPRTLGSGRSLEGSVLAGYSFAVPAFSVTWLVGPAFGEAINAGTVADRWGARASVEMYVRPTDLTMTSASVSYSTVTNHLQVQTKAGLKIFGDLYFGPEAKFSWQNILPFIATTTPVSSQQQISSMRVGAHLSSFNIGPLALSVSGGWAHDRDLGSGYYGSVSFYQAF